MRRVLVIFATVLALLGSSCGSDEPQGISLPENAASIALSDAEAAPTVVGTVVDAEPVTEAVAADSVIVGIASTELVPVRALPGADQPLAGEIAPGTRLERLESVFQTEDGVQWQQIQADGVQGWVPSLLAYRGPSVEVTDQVLSSLAGQTFASADEAADAVSRGLATQWNATQVVPVASSSLAGTDSTTVTRDVLGFTDDDSLVGYRLTIAVTTNGGAQPVSVFQSILCDRGISAAGSCL